MSHDPAMRTEEYQVSPQPVAGSTVDEATGPYTPDSVAEPHPGSATPVMQIPGYVIERELARGGMGRVLSGRELALDREVAIKTLLPNADPTRFVTEAKITARLPHPSIPPVHALGTLADGTPYLAMKLVRGQTLAEQLKDRPQPLHDLPRFLQVFEQIAQAVGFAHAQGILHRDLKPANVMVGAFGEVQVMDWGLAKQMKNDECRMENEKAVSEEATTVPSSFGIRPSALTHAGAVMGTPSYMAPEQARGEAATAASDVFALGGILCSILTGKAVFGGASVLDVLQQAAVGDTTEALARLDASGADPKVIALARRCLAVSPSDRPTDGKAVATEVATYRAGVEARLRRAETERAEAVVREGEQRKRRRVVQWAGAMIAAVLLVGTAVSLWQMLRAMDAEVLAKSNEQKAKTSEDKAIKLAASEKEHREAAQQRLEQVEKGADLLATIFHDLDMRYIEKEGKELKVVLGQRFKKAARQLRGEAIGDPHVVAKLQLILGESLFGFGSFAEALALLEESSQTRRANLGANHPDTLDALNCLAMAYQRTGQHDRAIGLFKEVHNVKAQGLGVHHQSTLTTLNNLAEAYLHRGQPNLALPLLEQVCDVYLKSLGTDHQDTLTVQNNLALAYQLLHQFDRAIPLYEKIHDVRIKRLGPNHPDTLTVSNNLATAYGETGQRKRAIILLEQVRDAKVKHLGADHPDTLATMGNLATEYRHAGQLDQAIKLYELVRAKLAQQLGPNHPNTLITSGHLALAYKKAGQHDRAIPLYEQVYGEMVKKFGEAHQFTLTTMFNWATAYQATGQFGEALLRLKEAAKIVEQGKFQNTLSGRIIGELVFTYEHQKQFDQAEVWRRKWLAVVKAKNGPDSVIYADELAGLGLNLRRQTKHADAEAVMRECLVIREKKEPDDWRTFNTQSLLGAALLGRARSASKDDHTESLAHSTGWYQEAEPLLLKGYEGMKAREKTIPPQGKIRLPEALDRLIELYTATNKPDEVKKWQAERAKYPEAKKPEPRK